jgi:hypothetical protein
MSRAGLRSFEDSIAEYEAWMRAELGDWLVEKGLKRKHKRMRDHPFLFLRATCWRWAEAAPLLCPDLIEAPAVPSVGDAHAGNFGLWRDAEARLVWGVNDLDEAAMLPWPLDLVRLCASVLLAVPEWSAAAVTDAALAGYEAALARPAPFVLERDHGWLRDAFAAKDKQREEFWQELEDAEPGDIPDALRDVLIEALPAPGLNPRIAPRDAGAGSLGRPRYVALCGYRGGPVAVEIKGVLPSCWITGRVPGLAQRIATGPHRSPDPHFRYSERFVLRRLAPNSRKVTLDEVGLTNLRRLIAAMAADLAAVHAETDALAATIAHDLAKREQGWLEAAAVRVADWTRGEHEEYKSE